FGKSLKFDFSSLPFPPGLHAVSPVVGCGRGNHRRCQGDKHKENGRKDWVSREKISKGILIEGCCKCHLVTAQDSPNDQAKGEHSSYYPDRHFPNLREGVRNEALPDEVEG